MFFVIVYSAFADLGIACHYFLTNDRIFGTLVLGSALLTIAAIRIRDRSFVESIKEPRIHCGSRFNLTLNVVLQFLKLLSNVITVCTSLFLGVKKRTTSYTVALEVLRACVYYSNIRCLLHHGSRISESHKNNMGGVVSSDI